ncbi:hypothetical protein Tco_1036919 [Tanacetum coccineum]
MDHVKSISTAKANSSAIRRIISGPYAVSNAQYISLSSETVLFPCRLHSYYYNDWKEAREVKILETYDHTLPQKEKDLGRFTISCFIHDICFDKALADLGASVSVMPFSTYSYLGLDFIILDISEDDDVPLILERPFLSTAHAKIDVFKRKFTLRVREEKLVFKSIKPATSIIRRVYMVKERTDLDSKTEFVGEAINESFNLLYGNYIELNDLDMPLEPRMNQDDFESTLDFINKPTYKSCYKMKFSCMIGYRHVNVDFLPSLSINIMTKHFYNFIIKDKGDHKGKNLARTLIDIPIFVENFSIILGFLITDDVDITSGVVQGIPLCKNFVSCQKIMERFAHEDAIRRILGFGIWRIDLMYIYPDDLKSDKDNDDDEIDMIQSSGGIENTHGSNKLLEASHDKINNVFKIKSFVLELNVSIVAWNYLVNGMLFNLIKNLYVPFGIPFDLKRYYKDGDCTRMLRRPRDDGQEVFVSHAWRRLFEIRALLVQEFILEFFSTCRIGDEMRLDVAGTLCFQMGGARHSMTWRQFILALGLHTTEEMAKDGFEAYWLGSERVIPDKGDLSDYWVEISFGRDFLRDAPSYTYIRDPVRRLCHKLISYNISGRGHAPKRHVEERKSGARLSRGYFIGRLAHHFGMVGDDGLRGLSVVTREILLIDMVDEGAQADPAPLQAPQPPPPPLATGMTMPQRLGRLEEEMQGLQQDVRSLRRLVERSITNQGRFSTWMISCMAQLMEASWQTYQAFDGTFRGSSPAVFERRTIQRTGDANTFTAQQDEQQPDP